MDDLVQFLRDQLDEDERIARAATEGPWIAEVSGETGHCVIPADAQSAREFVTKTQLYAAAFDAEHIAAHNPARVLREIDAKQRLLYQFEQRGNSMRATVKPPTGGVWDDMLRLLALPYADRPGYREEWRP